MAQLFFEPYPTPEGATARITIVLPAEVLERVKERAEEIATPPSLLIRQWIMERDHA